MNKMSLRSVLIALAIYIPVATSVSNDIVASLHCKLLCKEAGGIVQDFSEKNVCKCAVDQTITDAKLGRLEDLSANYKLPLILAHNHIKKQMKRELTSNLLDDLRLAFEQNQPLWANNADEIASDLNAHKLQLEEDIKGWQREHLGNVFENVAPQLDAYKQEFDNTMRSWREQQENSWLDGVIPNLEEQRQEWEDALKTWQQEEAPMLLGQIAPNWEQQQQELQEQQEDLEEKMREHFENVKLFLSPDQHDSTLGQMPPPTLINYESKGIHFPKPQIPNLYNPPMQNVLQTLPNLPISRQSNVDPLANIPSKMSLTLPLLPFLQQRGAPLLPATSQPILENLKEPIDQMLENLMKNNAPLMPFDPLNNAESEFNQPRVEPTPIPSNLYSIFFPYNRPFLSAPLPEDIAREIEAATKNPGDSPLSVEHDVVDSDKDMSRKSDNSDKDRIMNKSRLETQLTDATKSRFEQHVVDSVKKSHPDEGKSTASKLKRPQMGGLISGKQIRIPSIILQPEELNNDSEEDLETLA